MRRFPRRLVPAATGMVAAPRSFKDILYGGCRRAKPTLISALGDENQLI